MNKIRLKQAGAVALSCMVFLSAKAADTRQFTLKALGETRVTIPQGETQAVRYWLSNHSDQIRTLSMKPIKGITQQVDGDGDYCANLITLKPGQSCVLKLQVNSNELGKLKNIAPLVCENGANWFDGQVVMSESCVRPLAEEKLSVNVIPMGKVSLSVKIEQPSAYTSAIKNKRVKNFCYNSLEECRLTLFAGGGTGHISLTSTSTTTTAHNIHAVLPWADVTSTTCPTLAPGATCQITFNSGTAMKHPQASIQIVGDNTGPAVEMKVVVLGVGDTYQDGLIYVVNPGLNSGMLAFATDNHTIASWGDTPNTDLGTLLNNGFYNTEKISDVFPTSPASICKHSPGHLINYPTQQWYLPSYDEMNTFVLALAAAYGDPIPVGTFALTIDSAIYYWTSSEGNSAGIPASTPSDYAYQTSFVLNMGEPVSLAASKQSGTAVYSRCIRRFS